METMENPKCPSCGGEMRYRFFMSAPQILVVYFECSSCHSESPNYPIDPAATEQEKYAAAYAAAMKREPKKGEWSDYIAINGQKIGARCSVCRLGFYYRTNFCPNCGADMRGRDAK